VTEQGPRGAYVTQYAAFALSTTNDLMPSDELHVTRSSRCCRRGVAHPAPRRSGAGGTALRPCRTEEPDGWRSRAWAVLPMVVVGAAEQVPCRAYEAEDPGPGRARRSLARPGRFPRDRVNTHAACDDEVHARVPFRCRVSRLVRSTWGRPRGTQWLRSGSAPFARLARRRHARVHCSTVSPWGEDPAQVSGVEVLPGTDRQQPEHFAHVGCAGERLLDRGPALPEV
jgi:hypothetical protein